MAVQVSNVRRKRHGRLQVTIRVRPEKPGHAATAPIVGRVCDGALVTANGLRWRFDR